MNLYALIKTLHVISSVLLVGTGFGSAFYMFFVNRSGNLQAQTVVARLVVRADWWFTTPAVIVQPISGFALAHMAGWPLDSGWLLAALVLFGFAGICWLPVVWLQIRMAAMLKKASENGGELSQKYWDYARLWERLGYPAFIAMVVVFYLMVAKPALNFGGA